ncbi:hypothetical protein Dimus_012749 [Dionaea muscipula]
MSGFRRSGSARGIDSLSDLLKDSLPSCYTNKPDSRQHDVFSPVSPLRPTRRGTGAPSQSGAAAKITTTTTTARSSSSSSSSSSGSVSDRVGRSTLARKSHSDEISGNSGGGIRRPGHCRSKSSGSVGFRLGDSSRSSYGGGSVSSPQVNVLPAGNIIPSGRIPPTGLTREPARKDVLGSGKGNYGHGSIIRGCVGGGGGCSRTRGDSEEWNRAGHEAFEKGNYADAIGLFDRAITAAPGIASYRINLATAMGKMGRVVEAVEACEVALRLESHCSKADHLMACLLLRKLVKIQGSTRYRSVRLKDTLICGEKHDSNGESDVGSKSGYEEQSSMGSPDSRNKFNAGGSPDAGEPHLGHARIFRFIWVSWAFLRRRQCRREKGYILRRKWWGDDPSNGAVLLEGCSAPVQQRGAASQTGRVREAVGQCEAALMWDKRCSRAYLLLGILLIACSGVGGVWPMPVMCRWSSSLLSLLLVLWLWWCIDGRRDKE